MALDGVGDPVAATTSTEAVLASASADTNRVFRTFLRLCEAAGPDRCALASHGPVAARVNRFLVRLRRHPIPDLVDLATPAPEPRAPLTVSRSIPTSANQALDLIRTP